MIKYILLPVLIYFCLPTICFATSRNSPSQSNFASTQINWLNLATLYKERYYTRSGNRLDKYIAEQNANAGNLWRLNPKLEIVYNKSTVNNSQTSGNVNISQTFPTGTSVSFSASQTIDNNNVNGDTFFHRENSLENKSYLESKNFTVSQNLLKGSFLYGFPDVKINHLNEKKLDVLADETFAKGVLGIYNDYVDALNATFLLKQAQVALGRSKKALEETQDAINQGFKAKSDIYSFEIGLNTNQMNLETVEAQYTNALKKFSFELFQNPADNPISISNHENLEAFIDYLNKHVEKKLSYEESLTKIQHHLDLANAEKAKRDALPQLDFSFTIANSTNQTGYAVQTNGGSYLSANTSSQYQEIYGLTFSMPIYSTFMRDKVSVANAAAIQSQSALAQEVENTSSNWEIDKKNVEIGFQKYKLKLQIKMLNEKNLEAVQNQYRDGKVTNTDVQTTQSALDSAEVDTIIAQAELLKSLFTWAYHSGCLLDVFYES